MAIKERAKIKARLVGLSREAIVLDIGVQDLELNVANPGLLAKAGPLYGRTVVVVISTITKDNGNDYSNAVTDVAAAPEDK